MRKSPLYAGYRKCLSKTKGIDINMIANYHTHTTRCGHAHGVCVPLFMNGESEDVLVYVRRFILICGPCYVFVALILILRNGLQGCGFGWIPMVVVVLEMAARSGVTTLLNGRGGLDGICAAPCAAWICTGFQKVQSFQGLMLAIPVSYLTATIGFAVIYFVVMKRQQRKTMEV